MESASSVEFAHVALILGRAADARGLIVPGFRSPPRLVGVDRSIRRRGADGSAVVAVRVRGRPQPAVVADMIEGVVVANGLASPESDLLRTHLWTAVASDASVIAANPAAA